MSTTTPQLDRNKTMTTKFTFGTTAKVDSRRRRVMNVIARILPEHPSVRSRTIANEINESIESVGRDIYWLTTNGFITTQREKFHHNVSIRDGLFGGETTARHWENPVRSIIKSS
jgi:hypothetical protein